MYIYDHWKQGAELPKLPHHIKKITYSGGVSIRSTSSETPVAFHTENNRKVVILSDFTELFTLFVSNFRPECYERLLNIERLADLPAE